MDISVYISELLYVHDCIVVPGFGGFIANYKPAEIHPILHTVYPPAKALSFNRNLSQNDGLLASHLAGKKRISLEAANGLISDWVSASHSLLRNNEVINLHKIGKLHADIEGNLQFEPDEQANYLKTSYGLKSLVAEPVLRGKQIEFTEKFSQETKRVANGRRTWNVAAIVLLLVTLAVLAQLTWMGVEVKGMKLDEASVFGFVSSIFKTPDPEVVPLPVNKPEQTVDTAEQNTAVAADTLPLTPDPTITNIVEEPSVVTTNQETNSTISPSVEQYSNNYQNKPGHTYYVIIGAFTENDNVEAALKRLQAKYPDSVIITEKGTRLTKIGYAVGDNFRAAKAKLEEAQQEDPTYWLMTKN